MSGKVQDGRSCQVGDEQEDKEEEPDDQVNTNVGAWMNGCAGCHAADDVGQIPDEGQTEREKEEVADPPRISGQGDGEQGEEEAEGSHSNLHAPVRLARVVTVERAHCDEDVGRTKWCLETRDFLWLSKPDDRESRSR